MWPTATPTPLATAATRPRCGHRELPDLLTPFGQQPRVRAEGGSGSPALSRRCRGRQGAQEEGGSVGPPRVWPEEQDPWWVLPPKEEQWLISHAFQAPAPDPARPGPRPAEHVRAPPYLSHVLSSCPSSCQGVPLASSSDGKAEVQRGRGTAQGYRPWPGVGGSGSPSSLPPRRHSRERQVQGLSSVQSDSAGPGPAPSGGSSESF